MTRPQRSMDGFIPRRSGASLGRQQTLTRQAQGRRVPQPAKTHGLEGASSLVDSKDSKLERAGPTGLTRADISQSLRDLDDTPPVVKKRRSRRLVRPKNLRRTLKRVGLALLIIGVVIGGYLGVKAFTNLDGVFSGGLLGLTQRNPLKQDANGRSNVLIFGTSEDSEDHNANGGAGGPLLTDSIMVLSVNQEEKDAFMVSIPRDLWVKFDEPCSVGWQEKINSVYQCGSDFGENPEAGAAAMQKKVGEVLGMDLQYYAQIDFSVVTKAVDAVGGVEVTIESNPPGIGILDRNFDWRCNYQCHYVKYDDGQKVHLDGEHALALARARNAAGGYGIGDNFGREKNQQMIMKALREKALSVGTLTNIGKVTALLDAMGDNLKTSVDTSEIQTIMALAGEVQGDAIQSLDLRSEEAPLVTTACGLTASVVCPVAGLFDYSKIKAYVAKQSSSDPVVREGATIAVLNGSGMAGVAQKEADWLESKGFDVGLVSNAPDGDHRATQIFRREATMDATKAKLESLYGVDVQSILPVPVSANIDFIVIVGQGSPER